jgi:fibronectin type 3 domain-containing protein
MSNLGKVFVESDSYCVTLAWDPSPSPDVVGYVLRYGTASGDYNSSNIVGNVTTLTVSNRLWGITYYYVVTAFNAEDVESDYSNEVEYKRPE